MIFEILNKFLGFETPWVRKNGFLQKRLFLSVVVDRILDNSR